MSLIETQNLLARLYTNAELRRRFFIDPETVGRENNLTEREAADLARLLPAEMNAFAAVLFRKRLRAVEKSFALTRRVLEKDFELYFREFSERFHPASSGNHVAEALNFALFLKNKALKPVWISDLVRFESAAIEFYGLNRKLVARRFAHDIRSIVAAVSGEDFFGEFKKRKTRALWLGIGKRARHFVW